MKINQANTITACAARGQQGAQRRFGIREPETMTRVNTPETSMTRVSTAEQHA